MSRPTHLNSQKYSNIRQSLRNMPPVNPPLPRENNTNINNAQPHHLRDLFSGKVGIIRNPLRRKHLPPKTPQGRSSVDVSSSNSSRSRTGTSSSYSNNHHLRSSNTDSNQTYSYHSSSVSDYYTTEDDDKNYSNNILDADVRHTHDASTYAHTFDFNYAEQFSNDNRPTFDYDYTQQHYQQQPSQRLISLQQHLEEKSLWKDAQLEKYRQEEPTVDDESWRTDALVSQHVAMEQALQQSSIQSEQLKSPPEELYAKSTRNSSIGDNIDQGLLDDIIRSLPQRDHGNGEEHCDLSVLKEMGLGLRTSSNKPLLPEWILNDVLEAEGDVDPGVLKELVASTVSNERSSFNKSQSKSDPARLRRRREEDEDVRGMDIAQLRNYVIKDTDDNDDEAHALLKKKEFIEALINDDTSSAGISLDRIDSGIDDHRKIPMEILHTHDGKKEEERPSAADIVAIDDLGPIPPTTNGILGNSLTSMVESHPDSPINDTGFFGNSFISIGADSHPTVTTVEEDTRGPIPTDDIIGCVAKSSITLRTKSVKEDHPPDAKIEDRKMQSEVMNTTKGGSVGSSSASYKTATTTKDSTPSSEISDTYSDQKLSPQSTAQSSSVQSQSASYCLNNTARSTIEYPSDEETLKRPTIHFSSSVSEDNTSIPPVAETTKPTLDNELLSKDDMSKPKLPSLGYPRRSSSFSFSEDQEASHVAHTKPSLGFLKRRRHVHPCSGSIDEDAQATTMKMRRDLLELMQLKTKAALQVHNRRKTLTILNPINI